MRPGQNHFSVTRFANPQPNFNRNPFRHTQQTITNHPNFNIKQTIKGPRPADSDQSRMSIDELRLQDAQEQGPTDPNCNQHFYEQELNNQYQIRADSNQLMTPSELNENISQSNENFR